MRNIVDALSIIPGAKNQLSLECQQRKWFTVQADASEEDLVKLVLVRVKQKASELYTFITMLQSVEGMDQIVANLGLPKRQEQSDSGRVESDTYSMDRSVASHLPTEYVDHSSVNLSTNPQQASSSSDNPQLVAGQNDSEDEEDDR